MRVLFHIDQVFLGCAIYKPWTSLKASFDALLNIVLFGKDTQQSLKVTGLGYNSETNDYKVVRFSYCWPQLPQAYIYSLSLGSWKRLPSPSRPSVILYSIDTDLLPVPFVSGALHWMVYVDENVSKSEEESWQRQHFILTFDVNKEKWTLL